MHIPKHFEETDLSVLHSLVKSHPLGTWVSQSQGELIANHIPFLIDNRANTNGVLLGHVAKANPVWKTLSENESSIVIFQGAETYITPSWFPSKHEHGKAVPTWNYAVVHIHGVPRIIEDKKWILSHLNALTDEHESNQESPWEVADAPKDFVNRMLKGIVGIEITIERIEGKWKTSQNKADVDKLGVIAGLNARNDAKCKEMMEYVKKNVSLAAEE